MNLLPLDPEKYKTSLELWVSLDKVIKENLPDWLPEKQQDAVIMWFDKINSKDVAILIADSKKANIKEMRRE